MVLDTEDMVLKKKNNDDNKNTVDYVYEYFTTTLFL